MKNTSSIPISHYKVLSLPSVLEPNSVYYVLNKNKIIVEGYITSKSGSAIPLFKTDTEETIVNTVTGTGVTGTAKNPKIDISTFVSSQLRNQVELSNLDGKLVVVPTTSPDNSINISKTSTELRIQLSSVIQQQIDESLRLGDNISNLTNDVGYVTLLDITEDKNFLYTQNIPDNVWTIEHILYKYPSVSVKDSAGTTVYGQVDYISTTKIIITFNSSFSGVAILN